MSDSKTIERPTTKANEKLQTPRMYVVVVHNDPFTPRNFVVEVLRRFFMKDEQEAQRIMLAAHKGGHSVVAAYTHEVAEMKAGQANRYSKDQGRLLLFSVEKE